MRTVYKRNYYDNTWSNGEILIAVHTHKIVATMLQSIITINTESKSPFSERLDVTVERQGERTEVLEYDDGIFGRYLVAVCANAVTYKPMNERTSGGMYCMPIYGNHWKEIIFHLRMPVRSIVAIR